MLSTYCDLWYVILYEQTTVMVLTPTTLNMNLLKVSLCKLIFGIYTETFNKIPYMVLKGSKYGN